MDNPLSDIHTPRLILRLMDRDIISHCLNNDLPVAERLLGAKISPELLDHPSSISHGLKQLEKDPLYLPWCARAVILRAENLAIGTIRFHSTPNPIDLLPYATNSVEFGYRIFSQYRRLGYATEAVSAIMGWAGSQFGVSNFAASVSPANTPSLKVLAHFSFKKIGEMMDEVDGMEYLFLHDGDNKSNSKPG
jgi:ribosomal-protein-alanine N-acetyltransferase